MSDTIILAAILIPCLIVAIVFHEVSHGWSAKMLGDPTAKEARRLSLNPLRHVDPVGTVVLPGVMALIGGPVFGWAKPVPVNKWRLNNPRFGMMAVAAAGPGSNFVMAGIAAVVLGLLARGIDPGNVSAAMQWTITGIDYFILINIFLAFFNLLPIPPFDGSHIVEGLLPRSAARAYEKLRPVGMLLLVAVIALSWFFPDLGIIENIVLPPVEWLRGLYMGLAEAIAS
ncbi:site-2 protease family protein [Croceicoccus marinus]|jgi:Zn-dependent protease|uniref:Site-2 protease family protein n=1 Tax=Croceicoccus marinus TaxID=450378 RepID=A0A7G6VXC4_9SPHN|nr:site-2 protease family protein [Croceicoccus marinus]QNE06389.1 site-2 protease family protein [Croceicoccus marinus]